MTAQLLLQAQDHREFLFCKHAYLKVEVIASFGLATHTVLTYKHEDHQEDAFC